MKEYIEKSNSWFVKNNIFINILVSFIVAVTGIIVSYTQTRIYLKQTDISEKQVQPHFNIVTFIGEREVDGKFVDSHLRVYNLGGNFYKFDCEVVSFLRIETNNVKYMYPLSSFFSMGQGYFDSDKLVYEYKGYNNNLLRYDLNKQLSEEYEKKDKYAFIDNVSFIKIDYQDVFRDEHTIYFNAEDGEILDKKIGTSIFNIHSELTEKVGVKMIEEVSVKNIQEYLNGRDVLVESNLY
jgi:hypothetical protein